MLQRQRRGRRQFILPVLLVILGVALIAPAPMAAGQQLLTTFEFELNNSCVRGEGAPATTDIKVTLRGPDNAFQGSRDPDDGWRRILGLHVLLGRYQHRRQADREGRLDHADVRRAAAQFQHQSRHGRRVGQDRQELRGRHIRLGTASRRGTATSSPIGHGPQTAKGNFSTDFTNTTTCAVTTRSKWTGTARRATSSIASWTRLPWRWAPGTER